MTRVAAIYVMFLVICGGLQAAEKSIVEFYGITKVSKITITYAPKGDFKAADVKSWTVDDVAFVNKAKKLLGTITSTGTVGKDFAQDMPRWRVELIEDKQSLATLEICGIRLEAPNGDSARFGVGGKEAEFVEHIQSVAKK
jgi:hypothetical protein